MAAAHSWMFHCISVFESIEGLTRSGRAGRSSQDSPLW